MNQFLLDTNICIFYLKNKFNIENKIKSVGLQNCFISEISYAELLFGVEKSERKIENRKNIELMVESFRIVPIFTSLKLYAEEKARLYKSGLTIDEFDLLIGCSAVVNQMVMITNNTKHFNRIKNIKIEDWTIN